jgi:glucose/arabinose dehydrogenase
MTSLRDGMIAGNDTVYSFHQRRSVRSIGIATRRRGRAAGVVGFEFLSLRPRRSAMRSTAILTIGVGAALLTATACMEHDPMGAEPTAPSAAKAEHANANGFGVVSNVRMPPGYFMVPVATGINFPTALATSDDQIWVAEGGFLPGMSPKVKRVNADGSTTTVLDGAALGNRLMGPLTDVTYHDGWLWITHRQTGANGWPVGAISKFRPDDPGTFTTVITNLPSAGDHYTEEIVFGRDGRAYFSQGSATNSSVVGADNWLITAWLQQAPTFHDYPPVPIVLNGQDYRTAAAFPLDPTASLITGPFMPFGSGPVAPGTMVAAASPTSPRDGMIAGNGTVYSFDPATGGGLRLEGWGFRNPYGIGFDPLDPSTLFVTNNGADTRGVSGETTVPIDEDELTIVESRPIDEDFDDLFRLHTGTSAQFFGWPDFFHDEDNGTVLPVTDEDFCEELDPCPAFVLDQSFRNSLTVQPAVAELGYHTSANKFDFSTSDQFKQQGSAFVAYTGSFVPITGATEFAGYEVVSVSRTGQVSEFITHTALTQPVIFDPSGFNKPIDVKFMGDAMLIADFGVFEPGINLVQPNTGKVWAVCHGAAACKKLQR